MTKEVDPIVRVGIAGLGRSGWTIHAGTIAALAEKFAVAAVCDPDAGRQQEARERFGCSAYADYDAFLRDPAVELVVVATPSHMHADYAIRALRAGKMALVEKPMARDTAEVDAMIAAARETGRLLTVFQNMRYSADYLKVREVIQSGKLGRIVQICLYYRRFNRRWDWQTLKEFGGGQLGVAGSHYVDMALQLMGECAPRVYCHAERTPLWTGDADSHVKIILEAEGAPVADIELTSACAYAGDPWLVMGTQGGLTGTAKLLRCKYFEPGLLAPRPLTREPIPDRTYFGREPLPWIEESCDLAAEGENGDKRYYLDLWGCLREGRALPVTPESVRREIAVLEECRRQSPV